MWLQRTLPFRGAAIFFKVNAPIAGGGNNLIWNVHNCTNLCVLVNYRIARQIFAIILWCVQLVLAVSLPLVSSVDLNAADTCEQLKSTSLRKITSNRENKAGRCKLICS